jgi:hypothetical protein
MASRLLLPFTSGVDSQAITYAVQLAQSQDAILVPLVLIEHKAGKAPYDVRLEFVQQSKDFLEMTKTIATRFHVPVECYECYTSDVVGSIIQMSGELVCESNIIVMSLHKMWLIQPQEAQALLKQPHLSLTLLRMPERSQGRGSMLIEHIMRHWQQQSTPSANELLTSP